MPTSVVSFDNSASDATMALAKDMLQALLYTTQIAIAYSLDGTEAGMLSLDGTNLLLLLSSE